MLYWIKGDYPSKNEYVVVEKVVIQAKNGYVVVDKRWLSRQKRVPGKVEFLLG